MSNVNNYFWFKIFLEIALLNNYINGEFDILLYHAFMLNSAIDQ